MSNQAVDSPCIKVCVVDLDTGYCIGCGRSRLEIARWARLGDDDRRRVIDQLPQRLTDMTSARRRKGGRRGRQDRDRQWRPGSD